MTSSIKHIVRKLVFVAAIRVAKIREKIAIYRLQKIIDHCIFIVSNESSKDRSRSVQRLLFFEKIPSDLRNDAADLIEYCGFHIDQIRMKHPDFIASKKMVKKLCASASARIIKFSVFNLHDEMRAVIYEGFGFSIIHKDRAKNKWCVDTYADMALDDYDPDKAIDYWYSTPSRHSSSFKINSKNTRESMIVRSIMDHDRINNADPCKYSFVEDLHIPLTDEQISENLIHEAHDAQVKEYKINRDES